MVYRWLVKKTWISDRLSDEEMTGSYVIAKIYQTRKDIDKWYIIFMTPIPVISRRGQLVE